MTFPNELSWLLTLFQLLMFTKKQWGVILICLLIFVEYFGCFASQNSIVGIAACRRMDSPEFKLWWGRDSLYLYTWAQRHAQAPVKWLLGLFPMSKVAWV